MKGILKTLLRLSLWLLVAAAVIGGLYWLRLRLDIPRGLAFAVAAVLLAALLGFILARRILIRRRRLSQIQKIVNLNPAGLTDEAPDSRLIERRWLRAVSIMRASYLGRSGDPLYALPWYLVMGKPGAGKSSAIAYSGLNAMLTDVGPEETGSSTRNCDWHFFREAVLLDTAGRYATPINEARDGAEWREFLIRLARYRRKEPLNGLVITVAADTLYDRGEHLLAEARCLRRRIDEIMRLLGAKFPVYLLATKLDLPAGLAQLLETLPEDAQKQSLGFIVQSPEEKSLLSVETRIGQALQAFSERLRSFCLYSGEPSPSRLLAWEEFQAMTPALRAYAEEIFAANPYQETPFLRGIFFSSALRDRPESSRAFPSLGDLPQRVLRLRKKVGGVFLHDFFRRVLPADRGLHRPLAEYLRWRSGTRTLAYGVMLLATFGLNLLFFLSFRENADLLARMSLPQDSFFKGGDDALYSQALYFEREFRKQTSLEEEMGGRTLLSMGFNQAAAAFRAYSEALKKSFNAHMFEVAAPNMAKKRDNLTRDTDDREFFAIMAYYVWLHDLLSAADQGRGFEELLKIPAMPQALLSALGLDEYQYIGPSIAYSVARDLYGLRDQSERRQYMRALRAELARLEEVKDYSLQWIVYRADALSSLAPVKGETFWSEGPVLSGASVSPVYTQKGLAVTLEYLEKLNLILDGETWIKASTDDFMRWYADNYLQAWQRFALDFASRTAALATRPVRGETIALMSAARNPYFTLLLRMDEELGAIRRYLNAAPAWMEDLAVLARALNMAALNDPDNEKPSWTQRLKKSAGDLYGDLSEDGGLRAREALDAKAQPLVKDVKAVLDALGGLVHCAMSDDAAFSAVKEAMPNENNKNAAAAPLALALLAAQTVNAKLDPDPDSPARALAAGPMSFFAGRLINQAACHIQFMWEGDVLARTRGSAPSRLQQNLFAEQGGLARDFADKTLEYILHKTLGGYGAQDLFGLTMPFAPEFLAFINAGTADYQPAREEYGVTVTGLPTSVNEGAAETPYAVELSLHCAREKQEFLNYNSPGSALFKWRRETCGDAGLSIRFKSIALDVQYAGENGFLDFLNDFQYGEKIFRAADFPAQASALGKLGVSDITVQYEFSGADELLNSYRVMAGEAPFIAAVCER